MKLYNEIKILRNESRKQKTVALEILKLVVGEADTIIGREGKISDEKVLKIISKLIQSNNEILALRPERTDLVAENKILQKFLPTLLTEAQIMAILDVAEIQTANSDGQAIGVAIKSLKGEAVDRKLVAELVKSIRALK